MLKKETLNTLWNVMQSTLYHDVLLSWDKYSGAIQSTATIITETIAENELDLAYVERNAVTQ